MKVAYNNCFGGFGLSAKASTEYAKRKGITLTFYNRTGCGGEYVKVDPGIENSLFLSASTKDLGNVTNEIPSEFYYYKSFDDGDRTDEDLISIIEDMGKEANGSCADLQIAEIPDGASYEIDEYDGNESVVPPRQTW